MATNDIITLFAEFLKLDVGYTPFDFNPSKILDSNKTSLLTFGSNPLKLVNEQWGDLIDYVNVDGQALVLDTSKLYYYRFNYTALSGEPARTRDIGFVINPFTVYQERTRDGSNYTPFQYQPSELRVPSVTVGDNTSALIYRFPLPPTERVTGLFGDTPNLFARTVRTVSNSRGTLWNYYKPFSGSSAQKTGIIFGPPAAFASSLGDPNFYGLPVWNPPMIASTARGPRDGSGEDLIWNSNISRFDSGQTQIFEIANKPLKIIHLKFLDLLKARYETWFKDWFNQQKGMSALFLWKDWWDGGAETGVSVGIGDGVTKVFKLPHPYIDDQATFKVYLDGVEQIGFPVAPPADDINWLEGKITFNTAPASSDVITADYSRYIKVRFSDTRISFSKNKEVAYDIEIVLKEEPCQ